VPPLPSQQLGMTGALERSVNSLQHMVRVSRLNALSCIHLGRINLEMLAATMVLQASKDRSNAIMRRSMELVRVRVATSLTSFFTGLINDIEALEATVETVSFHPAARIVFEDEGREFTSRTTMAELWLHVFHIIPVTRGSTTHSRFHQDLAETAILSRHTYRTTLATQGTTMER
jgi:hypothetical protein